MALLVIAFIFSGTIAGPGLKPYHLSGYAQGTTYHITYYATDSIVTSEQVDQLLGALDSSLSIYKPYSIISRFNNSEKGCAIDKHLKAVFRKSEEVYRKTGGIFDITIQPVVQAWGFGPRLTGSIPDSSEITKLMKCVGSDKIHLSGDRLLKDTPCLKLDVNGIAQGYSVDEVAAYLDRRGIRDYLVEIGGELRIKGRRRPGDEPMAIGIESPGNDLGAEPFEKIIYPGGGAITTSGNYRKYYQLGGKKVSHLIDARTGYPIQNELISVTVWAKDAITADGYDNALMAMGVKKALQFAEQQKNLEVYLIYRKQDGSVADTATAGFARIERKGR